ncbi:NYN domain-containing protein [Enterococcus casseliflavus]|uniref:NYN domain-containing protein n=2 Tax=Enterococcus casseliflavus TaxID=37734 RepID=UPI00132FA540|nr:NYN domain-containing protein [Enterococcus casseliflavus]
MVTSAIFMDYDNVSISLADYYKKDATELIKKLREEIDDSGSLRVIKAFCDFKHIKEEEMKGLDSLLVELRHVTSASSNGKSNASDIALVIDVVKSLYNSTPIDKYYIVSSDSDMFSLLKELKFFNKQIELIYLEKNIGSHYKESLESSGISSSSIEELLNVEIYQDFNMDNVESKLESILQLVANKTAEIKGIHGERGTVSAKAVIESLSTKYSFKDSKIIMDYLEKEQFLFIGKIEKYTDYRITDKGKAILGEEVESCEVKQLSDSEVLNQNVRTSVDSNEEFSVENNLKKIIELVNQLINETADKYRGKGTVGNKILYDFLGEKFGVENNKSIVLYLTERNFLETLSGKNDYLIYVMGKNSLPMLEGIRVIKKEDLYD